MLVTYTWLSARRGSLTPPSFAHFDCQSRICNELRAMPSPLSSPARANASPRPLMGTCMAHPTCIFNTLCHGGPTNTSTNTVSSTTTQTPTTGPTPTATTPPSFSSATFVSDGKRVKSIFNGTITTYFVGAHYEVTGSTVTKYYFAGAQRIALRQAAR